MYARNDWCITSPGSRSPYCPAAFTLGEQIHMENAHICMCVFTNTCVCVKILTLLITAPLTPELCERTNCLIAKYTECPTILHRSAQTLKSLYHILPLFYSLQLNPPDPSSCPPLSLFLSIRICPKLAALPRSLTPTQQHCCPSNSSQNLHGNRHHTEGGRWRDRHCW